LIRPASKIRASSTRPARATGTSLSSAAFIRAWAATSPGANCASCWKSGSRRSRASSG